MQTCSHRYVGLWEGLQEHVRGGVGSLWTVVALQGVDGEGGSP